MIPQIDKHLTDRRLMKVKDILLIASTIIGFSVWFASKVWLQPYKMDTRLDQVEKNDQAIYTKYVPMTEKHEIEIELLKSSMNLQYSEIRQELQSINRKLGR